MFRALLALTLLSFVCLTTYAEDWFQFRGPNGSGASSATRVPVNWDSTTNLLWRVKLPGYGASSPISIGDRLYVTCYSGYGTGQQDSDNMDELRLHVTAIHRKTGDIAWNRPFKPTLPESERVRDHGYAAATPASDGRNLYVFFGKSGVMSFDLDGNPRWRSSVGTDTHRWGCGTSPVLFDNLVIVNASVESGDLVAVNKDSGEEVWRTGGMQRSWNTPHLVTLKRGQHELVVSVEGSIRAFDPKTGEELWNCDGIDDYVCPSVISRNDIVYVIGGRESRAIAVRAGGRGDVTGTHRLWEAPVGANVSSPVIHDGHLYWVSDRNKTAYCVSLSDGAVVYRKRFPGQPYASTLVADDKLYVVTRFEGTFVLAAQPEFKELAHNRLDDSSTFNASPIIAGGSLILRSDEYLYCVGEI